MITTNNEIQEAINNAPFSFFTRDKSNGFICPICGNGSGKSGTGVKQWDKKPELWTCFKCGRSLSIINWLRESMNLSYMEAMRYGAEVLGMTDRYGKTYTQKSSNNFSFINETSKSTLSIVRNEPPMEELVDYSKYFDEVAEHLMETNYWRRRGLSLENCQRHKIGYDVKWRHPKASEKAPYTPRLIIPTSKYSYLAVDVRDRSKMNEVELGYVKMKVGSMRYLNLEVALKQENMIVVEGEIDALSFIELGYEAVAIGSTSMTEKFAKILIKMQQEWQEIPTIIWALDNDGAGQEKNKQGNEMLLESGIASIEAPYIYLPHKDANECLCNNRVEFEKEIQSYINLARVEKSKIENKGSLSGQMSKDTREDVRMSQTGVQELTGANLVDDMDSKKKENYTNGEYLKNGIWQQNVEEFKNYKELSTGFRTLDEKSCIYPGLYVIGAIPGLGKTTFCLQLAYNLAMQEQKILYFTYEQSRFELVSKDIARMSYINNMENSIAKIDAMSARRGGTGESVNKAIERLMKAAENEKIYESDFVESVDKLCDIVNREVNKKYKPIVIVDYLQVIAPPSEGKNFSVKEIVDYSVKKLKTLQRNHKLVVIVVSSFNRQNYLQTVDYESFKESGGIEYTADVLWGLQYAVINDEEFDRGNINEKRKIIKAAKLETPRVIELNCLKSRFSSVYSTYFKYWSAYDYFEECDEQEAQELAKKTISKAKNAIKEDDEDITS